MEGGGGGREWRRIGQESRNERKELGGQRESEDRMEGPKAQAEGPLGGAGARPDRPTEPAGRVLLCLMRVPLNGASLPLCHRSVILGQVSLNPQRSPTKPYPKFGAPCLHAPGGPGLKPPGHLGSGWTPFSC